MANLTCLSMLVGVCLLAPGLAVADLQTDVCRARAKDVSGYSGKPASSVKSGNITTKLSGSAAFGLSHESGTQSQTNKGPAFAGSTSVEKREQNKIAKYQRVFDECMQQ